jgi:hypothetical protein
MAKQGQVRKDVTLWKSDVEWFEKTYRGLPLSSALAFMLHEFKELHGDNNPQKYIENAAKAFKEVLEDRRAHSRGDNS